jgi:hypothetical protein
MSTTQELAGNKLAANAVSRCNGAAIFSFAGAVWLLLAAHWFRHLNIVVVAVVGALAAALIMVALRIQKRGRLTAEHAYSEDERRKNARSYGIVNAITWTGAFVLVNVLGNTGHKELILPGVVVIVGVHLFFMPPLYRHRVNTIAGICMVVWAVLCANLFHGQTIAGAAALGTGFIVWISAVCALSAASNMLESAGL